VTENDLKRAVLRRAYMRGWAVYHVTQQKHHNGGGAGYPDLTLARDREVLWIELKQQDADLTPEQRLWHDALPAAHVIRPGDLVSGRLEELLA
jgi:hypothetical protein